MSSKVISPKESEVIDLGNKVFHKYTSPTHRFEVKKTVLNGRSPENPEKAYVETDCPFAIYILKGSGKICLDSVTTELKPEMVIYVLENTVWYIEGDIEYVVFNAPIWYPDQMKEVDL
jgi:hypothetical protein